MIIDSHVHLVTARMVAGAKRRFDTAFPGIIDRSIKKGRATINEEMIRSLKNNSIETLAEMWITELDRNKIDRALFLPILGASMTELARFIAIRPDRFSGYLFLDDPHKKKAVTAIRKWAKSDGICGIKLYPPLSHVSVADRSMFPVYEEAAAHGLPVLIHFGITTAPIADYRYANPLDLMLPSKLFPDTKFIIAHFGAGFFREVLMLGFHASNIFLDTSGTNNWRLYLPEVMPLKQVFKRSIEVFGADKILFGTDTILNGKTGYRSFVFKEQKKALAEIKVKKEDRAKIMGGNATKLFGL